MFMSATAQLIATELKRVFIFKYKGEVMRLSDPDDSLSPEAVLDLYSHTYTVLTTATIKGPELNNDEVQYKFVPTLGTKG
jgi:PRTRC genetic system protein C